MSAPREYVWTISDREIVRRVVLERSEVLDRVRVRDPQQAICWLQRDNVFPSWEAARAKLVEESEAGLRLLQRRAQRIAEDIARAEELMAGLRSMQPPKVR